MRFKCKYFYINDFIMQIAKKRSFFKKEDFLLVDYIYPINQTGLATSTAWVDIDIIFLSGWSFELKALGEEITYFSDKDYILFGASSNGSIKWHTNLQWFAFSAHRVRSTDDYRSPLICNGGKVHVANGVGSLYSSFNGKGWCIIKTPKLTGQTSTITVQINGSNVNHVLDSGPSTGNGFPNIGISLFAVRNQSTGGHNGINTFQDNYPLYKISYLKYYDQNNNLIHDFKACKSGNVYGVIDEMTNVFYPGNENILGGMF